MSARRNVYAAYLVIFSVAIVALGWLLRANRGLFETEADISEHTSRRAVTSPAPDDDLAYDRRSRDPIVEITRTLPHPGDATPLAIPLAWFRGNLVGVTKSSWSTSDLSYDRASLKRRRLDDLIRSLRDAPEATGDRAAVSIVLRLKGALATRRLDEQHARELIDAALEGTTSRDHELRRIRISAGPLKAAEPSPWPIASLSLSKLVSEGARVISNASSIRTLQKKLPRAGAFRSRETTAWVTAVAVIWPRSDS